ncbi:MAG: discoidin domain-containing protein [Bacteroidaceae bacterium]|nr:discoidin domain-containing protein [Bacteroidaceae bacterium]
MKKLTSLILFAFALSICGEDKLEGFLYEQASAPDGNEWQSPERLALNKLQPRAHTFPFASADEARQVLPDGSKYFLSLDGTWKFHWCPTPEQRPEEFADPSYDVSGWDEIKVPGCWNVQGLGAHGEMKYGVPIYVNQPVIFYHEVKPDDWRDGVMREPKDKRWTTYAYRNEVGSYRRTFTVPADWQGRQIIINFDGVDSFFYLWINGHYVGFSKNSRNTASFDISSFIQDGENSVAVEVYRNSDGSFLEAQDMFRLPGIFRSTYLTAFPKVQISDLAVMQTQLNKEKAVIVLYRRLSNLSRKAQKGLTVTYNIYPVELYSDRTGESVKQFTVDSEPLKKGEARNWLMRFEVENPLLWSAEKPNRYVLVAELKDKKGRLLDCTSTYFGIRTVEIRETKAEEDEFKLAGRYFYINGKPVKLKGVNRHETNPTTGHAITREQMKEEVMLMKRGNINHVRLSHYSNDPYFYYLADKYGLYLEDEANIESHEYYYGEASLSHPVEWRAAHVARVMEAVRAHVNHPSIVIWSLGNEAGPGANFVAAYRAIKDFDTSRPVQYERNNDIVDMGSNQYPSVDWVRQAVKGTSTGIKYPYHISEYAHSMGNSMGNLIDYWKAIESTNFFCGAAIWDWVDQAIDTYRADDGTKYMGYGGDHGDWPNDGMFCMNGIMLPDLTPKPQYFEVKKVYQNVGVSLNEFKEVEGKKQATFTIFNKNYFEPITSDTYDIVACLVKDGIVTQEIPCSLPEDVLPRMDASIVCPVEMDEPGEYFLNVEFRLKRDMPWAKKGYVQMAEQLTLADISKYTEMPSYKKGGLKFENKGSKFVVGGKDFSVTFDNETGSLCAMQCGGKVVFENSPLLLSAFRAPVDNDNWARDQWFKHGLYDLQHKVVGEPDVIRNQEGPVVITYTVVSQAKGRGDAKHRPGKAGQPYESVADATGEGETVSFTTRQTYKVYPDGSVVLASSIVTSDPDLPLPRLGYEIRMPSRFDQYSYYGRGPLNNYNDRKTGSFIGLYRSTVAEQFVPFPKPQSMGNREDVLWCALQDGSGDGLQFICGYGTMSTSALPWSALQMTKAQHPHELPASDGTYLHLDCAVNGLGGNSCGQGGPLRKDRVLGALHHMMLIIRPASASDDLSARAKVDGATLFPLVILRDKVGKVTIVGDPTTYLEHLPICYRIGKGKQQKYTGPFDLRDGGTVYASYESDSKRTTSATFERIENVPVTVVYASSEEGPGREYARNLVDGDPNTIWHTMYSITVPKYPHWVDFDCGEEKLIKGFVYLPRQDGSPNGSIKSYKVQLSADGQTWTDPVSEGNFDGSSKEKKVMLAEPQRARYLRFTALSSQNGADFASGAEFSVLAE